MESKSQFPFLASHNFASVPTTLAIAATRLQTQTTLCQNVCGCFCTLRSIPTDSC